MCGWLVEYRLIGGENRRSSDRINSGRSFRRPCERELFGQAVRMAQFDRIRRCAVPVLAVFLLAGSCGEESSSDAVPAPQSTPVDETETELSPAPPTSGSSTTNPGTDPTSSANAPIASSSADPDTGCRRLTDFGADEAERWVVVNDGVMGGRSDGAVEVTESVLRFSGRVITDGGGFTSARRQIDGSDLAETTSVRLRVRADQRTYGLTLEDGTEIGRRAVSHRADLEIDGADDWTTTELRFVDLQPTVFGQPVNAPPFDPDDAREFGIIIADGRDGDFSLEIDWIAACA